jgi:hypothetical protein
MTESAGKKRLKILFFSQRFSYPMDTGGKIRTGKLPEQYRIKELYLWYTAADCFALAREPGGVA